MVRERTLGAETGEEQPRKVGKKRKYDYQAYLWLLPGVVLVAIFSLYPPIYAIYLSFTNSNGATTPDWIGFANYVKLFQDPIFWASMKNVVLFMFCGIVFGNGMAILLAELLYNMTNKKASGRYRFFFVLPMLVPGVVQLLIWQRIIFAPEPTGLMNTILIAFGGSAKGWYYDFSTAKLSIIFTHFPWIGATAFLIYLAGLQNMDSDMIEAAQLDGITFSKRFLHIDLPMISGQMKYFLILGVINGIQNFNIQMLFTAGGPGTSTYVPGYYLYERAFTSSKFGYASAIGCVLFLITLTATIINLKFFKNKEDRM